MQCGSYFHEIELRRIRKCLLFLGIQEVLVFLSNGSNFYYFIAVSGYEI